MKMSSIEKTLKPLKKVLKSPRTRSRTETLSTTEVCPKANVNLAAVEAAELVAEAVSRESRDASSSERIQVKS